VVDVNSYLRIPDGRSLLLVKGTSRFSIHKRWESAEHGYEIAEVPINSNQSIHPKAQRVRVRVRRCVCVCVRRCAINESQLTDDASPKRWEY
jgi:Lon protease-like protein